MQLAFGMPIFEYLTQHPQESADFNRTMIAFAAAELPAVAEAYDFSGVHRIVDVGGGTGALLATVLGRYPLVNGVLFDRPDVIDEAHATLWASMASRISCSASARVSPAATQPGRSGTHAPQLVGPRS